MDVIGGLIGRSWKLSPHLCIQLFYLRERWQGEPSFRILESFVKKGDVVVDIGANWGLYTHRLAQLVGRTGHVHAFEPEPSSLEALKRVRGKRSNITIYPLALSDHPGVAELHVPIVGGNQITAMSGLSV